ncbi:MAG: CRISPR-associated endonuclease Cas2 [Anaerolineae bacterium]|nr:CRISPR-associated endonuclease Cas2 [Anaerolineae bacterium]
MPEQRGCVVASYDITDTRRRTKVAQLLEGYGERVQYSVFELWVTREEMGALRKKLASLVVEEGSIRFYPLCAACEKKRRVEGKGAPTTLEEVIIL